MRKVSFEKRHFEFIARTIASMPEPCRTHAANAFALELRSTNPNFRMDRFIDACRKEEANA